MQSGVNGHNTYTSYSRLASSTNSFMKTSVAYHWTTVQLVVTVEVGTQPSVIWWGSISREY